MYICFIIECECAYTFQNLLVKYIFNSEQKQYQSDKMTKTLFANLLL